MSFVVNNIAIKYDQILGTITANIATHETIYTITSSHNNTGSSIIAQSVDKPSTFTCCVTVTNDIILLGSIIPYEEIREKNGYYSMEVSPNSWHGKELISRFLKYLYAKPTASRN